MKTCSKCKTEKPLEAFNVRRRSKNGRRSECKACEAEYRAINREKIAKRQAEHYVANREKYAKRVAEYHVENRDRRCSYQRAYVAKQRLKTLRALVSLGSSPTDAEVIATLSLEFTKDMSPVCKLADMLLGYAECGGEEHEAKEELLREITCERLEEQVVYQKMAIWRHEEQYG